jgi:hypothetical protein
MEQRNSLAQLIARWCREAVEKWGDDWPHISEHIHERMATLDEAERTRLADEAAATLSDSDSCSEFSKH